MSELVKFKVMSHERVSVGLGVRTDDPVSLDSTGCAVLHREGEQLIGRARSSAMPGQTVVVLLEKIIGDLHLGQVLLEIVVGGRLRGVASGCVGVAQLAYENEQASAPSTCAVCATPLIIDGVQRAHVHRRDVAGKPELAVTCTAAVCVANPWPVWGQGIIPAVASLLGHSNCPSGRCVACNQTHAGPTLAECKRKFDEVKTWGETPPVRSDVDPTLLAECMASIERLLAAPLPRDVTITEMRAKLLMAPPIDPLDVETEGVKLRMLIARNAANSQEAGVPCFLLSPAQRAAVSAHWSAELRTRVAAGKQADRARVVVDQEAE